MKKIVYFCLVLMGFLQPFRTNAQTFNGTTGPIPDATVDSNGFPIPSTVDFTANVTGLPGTIGANYTISNVTIDISHTWDSDLDISLIGPDGTTMLNLSDDNGDNGSHYTNTVFTDAASINITAGFPPFTGSFKPEGPGTFASVFNGSAANGVWKLRVTDDVNLEEGTLNSWSITFQAVNTPVVLTCPNNLTAAACQTQAAINAAFNTWLAAASGTGGCNGILSNNSTVAPDACGGSTTVTFTYTSTCAPLITTCQATFTVAAPSSPTPVFANCNNNTINLGCNPTNKPTCAGIAAGGFGGAVTASNSCGSVPVSCSDGTITVNGCARTQVFTFTAIACGQTSTCTRTYTWTETSAPSFNGTCQNGVTNLGCNPVNLPACDPNITGSNQCGPVTVTCNVGNIIVNGCNRQQTFLYVANAPGCGNFSTCQRVFNWQVTTAPVFGNCDNTINLGCNPATLPSCANINQTAFGGAITATNECGNVNMSCSAGPITSNGCNRTQVFTITATACGLTSTCTRTFTWTVATAPVFDNCTSSTTDLGCNPATLPSCDISVTATNECGAGPVTIVCLTGSIISNGCNRTQTITYDATACGLTTTCTRTFTWQVAPAATLTCPANTTATACQTQAAVDAQFAAWLATASFTGGCGAVLTNNNTGAPPFCGGSRTVTFTLTSSCQPNQTCQATFTVPAAPTVVLNCPSSTTTTACQTQSAVNNAFALWLLTASATGGCNGVLSNNNVAQGGAPPACGGSRTVTFTYTSSCPPFTTTCQATFTVPTAPTVVLTCPMNTTTTACQTQAAVDAAFATWLATASATGGCNGTLTNNSVALGGAPSVCGGSRTVTFTYTSACAPTTTTCQATYTVPAPPTVTLTCPQNQTETFGQTQAAIDAKFATWLATASASGGCGGTFTNNNTGAPPATGGSVTVTFTKTSTCAPLTTTCQASFSVSNTPPVVLNCPTNATASSHCLTQAQLNAEYNAWLATASGSGGCNGILTHDGGTAPSICSATATVKTVTFTYTSTCAPLTTTCQASFTVPAYPDFPKPPNSGAIRVCLAQTEQPIPPQVNDACGKPIIPTGPTVVDNPNTLNCEGTRTYTYTYTDCAGHSHDWSFVWTLDVPTLSVDNPGTATVSCPSAPPPTYPNTITDACGRPLTVTGPTVTSSPDPITCEGTRTYTWNLTDCAGNTNTWSWIITIERNDFTLPANGGSTVTCPAAANVVPTPPSKMSECGEPIIPTGPVVSATPDCEGIKTYTWTYTDCEGNSHDWSYIYTIERNDFTVPADGSATVSCPALAVAPTLPTVTSNCGETLTPTGPVVVNTPDDPLTCAGTRMYTYTYTDCEGNSHPWSFTYTVSPTLPVTITCPTNTTTAACQTPTQLNTAYVNWLNTASFSGGCGGSLTSTQGVPSICGGSTTLTFTHINACGNQSCQATFTVPTPPPVVLNCPTNQTEAFGQTQAAINAKFATWLATVSGSGGCNGVLTNNNIGAPPATGGTATVTFTYTSGCAPLTTTCQATFTVSSIPPVVLTCPTNATATSACLTQAQLTAEYNAWLATASGTGGCNGVLTNNGGTPPTICSATATVKTVTFTYTSTCAPLITTCQATFTVPAYPTYTVPANGASTVACPADATQPTPPTVMDGCNKTLTPTGPVITNNPNPIACEGTRTYTWTYTDCAGLVRTWSHDYTIERESFTVPANGAATVSNLSEIITPTLPLVTSNCGEILTPTGPAIVNNPNPLVCSGTSTYTYTYTDCEGNSHPWSFTYTLLPTVLNVSITGLNTAYCKDASTVTLTGNPTGGNFTIDGNAATTLNPATLSIGNHTVTYNFTDANGCSNSSSQTVTINALPIAYNVTGTGLSCNGSSGLAVGLSNSELGVTYQLKNGSSNIGTAQNGTNAAINFGNQGVGTYTVVATNTLSGCSATMAGSAVISANTAPPTIAVKDITLNLNSAGTGTVTPSQVDNGTTAFCTIATRQLSKTDFNCSNIGVNIVTFTATDVNNNSATATAKITVKDVSAPTLIVKDITVNLVDCAASITAAQVNNGSSDNCAITSMNVTPNTFAFANIGQNIVTFTATDASGNSTSTTLTVTVNNVTGSISGHAWKDLNNNGIEDGTGEIGVTGLNVSLYNSDANGNKIGTAISSMTTGVNGIYTFSNVNKGDYVIEIDKNQITAMGMFLSRKLNAGGNDALDNDFIFASGLTEKIVLDPCDITKKNITNVNAGITILGSIGDRFWKDNNNNGIQDNGETGVAGVNLELYFADANGNPTGAAIKTATTTAPNGDYRFEELDNGMYVVKTVLSSIAPTMELSKKKDLGGNDALDHDFDRFTGLSPKITIIPTDPTQKDILTLDGAIRNRTRGTIGDLVWKDLIENGVQDNCEKGVANVTMEIYMKNPQTGVLGKLDTISGVFTPNVPMFTTTTNATGKYLFSNLEDETWVVKVIKSSIAANMELSPLQNQGGNDASDSDFNGTTALSDEVVLDPYISTLRHNATIDAAIRNTPCDNLKAAAASFENATGTLNVANTTVNISILTTNSQILRTSQERAATIFADNAYSTKAISGGYLVIKDKRDENGLVTLNFNATVSNPILYFKDIVRRKLDLSSSVDVNGNPICMRKISGNADIQVDEMLMTLQNNDPAQAGSPTQAINQGAVVVQLIGDFSSIKIQSSSLFAASDNWIMSIASEDYNCGSPLVTLPIIVKNSITNILPKDPNNPTGNMLVTFEVEINNPTAIKYNNLFIENYLDEKWGAGLVGISEAPHIIFPHNSFIIQANPNYNGITDVNLLKPDMNNMMNGGELIRVRYSIELNPAQLNSLTNKSIVKALNLRFENKILAGSTSQPIFLSNLSAFNIPVYLPSSIVLPTNPVEDIAGGTVPVYYAMWLQCFGKSMVTPAPQCGKVTWGFDRSPKPYTQNCGNTGIWHTAFIGIDECGNRYYFTADFTSIDKNPPVWDMKPMDKSIVCSSPTASQDLAMWLNSAGGAWFSDPGDDKNSKITISSDFVNTNLNCANGPRVVKFTLTDACGNSTSETAKLSIVDSEAPKFTSVPANITVKCDATNYTFGTPTATDNCGTVILTSKDADTGVNCTTGGTKTRTWTVSDACGNTTTASQTIYFEPKSGTKPVVFTMTNKVSDKIIDCNEAIVFDTPIIESSCAQGSQTSSSYVDMQTAGKCGNNVNYIRKWTFTDKCNNQYNVDQTISVMDNVAPKFKAGLPTSFKMKKNLFNTWTKLYFKNFVTATDNCSTVTLSDPIYKVLSAKSVECMVVANDQCGNSSKYVCTVTFEDVSTTISTSNKETLNEQSNNAIANSILEEIKANIADETPICVAIEAVIYPNPISSAVNIVPAQGYGDIQKIQIYNSYGQNLLTMDVEGQQNNIISIDISHLIDATYLIEMIHTQKKLYRQVIKVQ